MGSDINKDFISRKRATIIIDMFINFILLSSANI
jgi:hypothetical protein